MTRQQLLALGVDKGAIDHRLRTGTLHRVHSGVYAVGHPPTTALQRAAAAVLACGPEAALSHYSALSLWSLQPRWYFPAHVTSPADRRHPGIVNHHSRLDRPDVRVHLGIRTTTAARALLDCAPTLDQRRLVRLIADARRAGLASARALTEIIERYPRHPGTRYLKPLLDSPALKTRSDFEVDFMAFCERYGLPQPQVNATVNGHEVDALFPEHRLIVECDGWDFHRDRHNFEADRERDVKMLAAGYPTVRVTKPRLTQSPDREAAWLHQILQARLETATGSPSSSSSTRSL